MKYQSIMNILQINLLLLSLCGAVFAYSLKLPRDPIAEVEAYITEKRPEINGRYRLQYHVAPPVGWMNDPNGFSYFNGEYHLFYQFYPYESKWGPMHWGHASSPDLVEWKNLPTALVPEEEMCFSGSAIEKDGSLVLLYTGHAVTGSDDLYNETQYLAFSEDGIKFHKYDGNPVLASPNGSPDFRDPKVWKHEDYYYVVIGTKTEDDKGRVLLYRSPDMIDWTYLSVIGESTTENQMGYMWECPDFFELNGKYVLLMSPQGVEPDGDRYKNLYQTGYYIGSFDYETFQFVPEAPFQEIDYGHDFYATQTMDKDGARYMMAWFGMWETPFPENVDGWAGAMTIVRELELKGERILMKPLEAMKNLRSDAVQNGALGAGSEITALEKTGEIIISELDLTTDIAVTFTGSSGGDNVALKWDVAAGKVVLDRDGDVRQVEWSPLSAKTWRIFLDTSSIEVFCGEGEVVFSTRVYPDGNWKITNSGTQSLKVEVYKLNRSVPE